MPFAAIWMDLEIVILSEVSHSEIYDITYMWNLKKGYKWTYLKIVKDVENKLMVTGGKKWGGINWKTGIDIYTLLYTE